MGSAPRFRAGHGSGQWHYRVGGGGIAVSGMDKQGSDQMGDDSLMRFLCSKRHQTDPS